MKINFRKISAVAASTLMAVSGVAFASASAYPSPFVVGGNADVAIVYGSNAQSLDLVQASSISTDLQSRMGSSSGGTTTTTSGETAALFTSGTKIYINDSLNLVKSVLTDSDLPTVLEDQSFSGNVDASIAYTIDIGSDPRVTFEKQPTSSDDPNLALALSTTSANYIYNATATFNKPVNFSHADSEGEELNLFGMDYTVSADTDGDTIVLLKSAEKVSLTSDSPTADVTVSGTTYTIELISASDSAATIAVTDSSGNTESKEISEAQSKTVGDITVAVTNADETNLKLSATVVAGSDKITLEDGSSVTIGEDNTIVDGTLVDFETGNPNNITTITISVYAPESDEDAIQAGEAFVDPIFGTFKVDFPGFNIDTESTSRETIEFTPNGDDKIDIKFTDHQGYEKQFQFAKNYSDVQLMRDDNGRNITVMEGQFFSDEDYVVVGNEDEGYLLRLTAVANSSSTSSSHTNGDKVEFEDVFSGSTYQTTWTSDGVGSVVIGGKTYDVYLHGKSGLATESYNVSLNYPDSSGEGVAVVYPTIQTSMGAKIMFYEPLVINLTGWDNDHTNETDLTQLDFPDGDGYTSVSSISATKCGNWTFTAGGTTTQINTSSSAEGAGGQFNVTIGPLKYEISNNTISNTTRLRLLNADGSAEITQPAIVIFEEKDDNSDYHALIIELEDGGSSDDGVGIDTIEDTWSNASSAWSHSRYSDSKKEDRTDLWGTLITIDSSDSDQKSATISYPDEQVYAPLYIAADDATITTSGAVSSSSTPLGEVLVKDSEVSSVATKNLIVVGGSCINSAAATLLGGGYCTSDFTDATGVGSGEFLIQSFGDSTLTSKIALLVAGYDAADTVNAAKYLTTQTVDTTAGKKYKGTSSTSAELVTTSE